MLSTREQTLVATIAASAVALGVPVYLCLPGGIVVTRQP